jgi:hypothetical protein
LHGIDVSDLKLKNKQKITTINIKNILIKIVYNIKNSRFIIPILFYLALIAQG